jgi:catechol 2,3-dioxygenase-like lactoylglutathione lyase family enzyme
VSSQISGLNHIHLVCSDMKASERWLIDGLGAELVERRESRGVATSELKLVGLRVLLRAAGEGETVLSGTSRRYGVDHFALEVRDVDATVERLRARGVEIARDPADSPQNRVAFIRGPDDVVIELVQPRRGQEPSGRSASA